ncbi:MAG: ATPase, T2SS/T4P/T4SS family [Candidatus Diapherotrites archaeon]
MGEKCSLGWKIIEHCNGKVLKENSLAKIIIDENTKTYVLSQIPKLKEFDEMLLVESLESYRLLGLGQSKLSPLEFLKTFLTKKRVKKTKQEIEELYYVLSRAISNNGPIEDLLKDPDLEEIAVIGEKNPVMVYHKDFGWLKTNLFFTNEEQIRTLTNSMASHTGKRITTQNPKIDAELIDGSRMNACIKPIAKSGACITIRKFMHSKFDLQEIGKSNTASFEMLAFLWMAIQSDCSILICGNTGSGKTTLLNALLYFIPKSERIILVEDTPEIKLIHEHSVRLCTSINVNMHQLIENTMRMRPDRVIIGEIRTKEEVHAFIDSALAGQGKGCFATFHAKSSEESISRFSNYGVMQEDISSIDLIITQKRRSIFQKNVFLEQRKLEEIAETNGKEINVLYFWDQNENKFKRKNNSKRVIKKILATFSLSEEAFLQELKSRAEFLKNASFSNNVLEELGSYASKF